MFNETVSLAVNTFNVTRDYISQDLFSRGVAIVDAPFKIPEMLWMLLPILATAVLMEFYFGRYKEEELGWNTAYSNAIVLTFVAIDLFRRTYEPLGLTIRDAMMSGDAKIIISMVLFGFAILLVLVDFFHFLPKRIAYLIGSSSFVLMIALLGIIVVYSQGIPLNWTTLLACAILFVLANLLLHVVYWIVPAYSTPLQRVINLDDFTDDKPKKVRNYQGSKAKSD